MVLCLGFNWITFSLADFFPCLSECVSVCVCVCVCVSWGLGGWVGGLVVWCTLTKGSCNYRIAFWVF